MMRMRVRRPAPAEVIALHAAESASPAEVREAGGGNSLVAGAASAIAAEGHAADHDGSLLGAATSVNLHNEHSSRTECGARYSMSYACL